MSGVVVSELAAADDDANKPAAWFSLTGDRPTTDAAAQAADAAAATTAAAAGANACVYVARHERAGRTRRCAAASAG